MNLHKLVAVLVAAALLASSLAVAGEADAVGVGVDPYLYGDTTVYEVNNRPLNITTSIDSIETVTNQTVAKVSVKVLSPTYDTRGEVLSLDQYHKWRESSVLQYYLVAGLTVDFDRNTTIGRIWPIFPNLTGIELDNTIAAFYNHTTYFALDQNQDTFTATVTLPVLSEGAHNVTLWAALQQNYLSYYYHVWAAVSETVGFTVDTTSPEVTVMSPTNQTYIADGVPLNFHLNEPASKICYSLDGATNVTVTGNTTLPSLAAGEHNVTVYAWDEASNVGTSDTVSFNFEPALISLPAAVTVATGLAVLAVAAVILWRKRRRAKNHAV